jgi:hypothetical protein
MTNTTFTPCRNNSLLRIWLPTGNARVPLTCVWVTTNQGTEEDSEVALCA